eukprot:535038_1
MNGLPNALFAQHLQQKQISAFMSYLTANDYDTESIIKDIFYKDNDSFLARFCQQNKFDDLFFNTLIHTMKTCIKFHQCTSFKDMDYAISKYYESIRGNSDNYFNEHHIGKFELICDQRYISERNIPRELNKYFNDCRLTVLDFDAFPFKSNITGKRTKRKLIQKILRNCWKNKYFYDINGEPEWFHQCDLTCKHIESCLSLKNIQYALQLHAKQVDLIKLLSYFTKQYKDLIKDFHHIITTHLNFDKELNAKNYAIINKIITTNVPCDIEKCNPFKRNNRNKNEESIINGMKFDEYNDQFTYQYYVDLLDNIHCYFIHSYDIGFKIETQFAESLM